MLYCPDANGVQDTIAEVEVTLVIVTTGVALILTTAVVLDTSKQRDEDATQR
jgi:hypothetical protein